MAKIDELLAATNAGFIAVAQRRNTDVTNIAEDINNVDIKAEETISYVDDVVADITREPYNGVGDYNVTTGVGTDNSAAYLAAAASGARPYLPPGNFLMLQGEAHRKFEAVGSTGPGKVIVAWFTGNEPAGDTFPVGRLTARVGNDLQGGVLIGGNTGTGRGSRLSATRISGALLQPSSWSYNEFNLYARLPMGTGARVSGTNRINYTYGNLADAGDLIEVGDYISHGRTVYKIASLGSTFFTVVNINGTPVVFSDNEELVWRWSYDVCVGTCSISGSTLSVKSGEELWTFQYGSDEHRIQINGTWRGIASLTNPTSLQLVDNLGTVAEATFRMKTHSVISSVIRIQNMYGAREECVMFGLNEKGECGIDLQGYVSETVKRIMPFYISGATRWDGNVDPQHFKMNASGSVGLGVSWEDLEGHRGHLLVGNGDGIGDLGITTKTNLGDGAGNPKRRWIASGPGIVPGYRVPLIPE